MREFAKFRRGLLVGSALGVAGLMPVQAFAQQANESGGIAEIVVTAQKREQSIQDVPVAVTAVTQDTLQVNRVTNVMDLNGLAPGLLARANAGSNGSPSYTMRGIFATGSDPAQDRQVATYIDGVYVGGTRGAIFDLPDIQRVEVLRGPQGTLFGRNATVGAVSISTRDPAGELNVRAEATAGTHDSLRFRATVDTPQIGIFSGFVTYVHDQRRGDIRNVGGGLKLDFTSPFQNLIGKTTSPYWLGSKNSESIFAALKADISDSLSVTYKFDWTRNDVTPDARVPLWNGGLIDGLIQLQGGDKRYGGYVPSPDPVANQRPSSVNNAFTTPGYIKASGHNVTINWQVTDSLSFKNTAAWRTARSLSITSIMGVDGLVVTPAIVASPTYSSFGYNSSMLGNTIDGYLSLGIGQYRQFSDELQMNFNSDLVTLTAGALYYKSHEINGGPTGSPTNYGLLVALGAAAGTPTRIANLSYNPNGTYLLGGVQEKQQDTKSLAAYAQAEVHVTPQLDLVLGGRVTRDEKSQTFVRGGTVTGGVFTVAPASTTTPFKKTKPTFSIGVNYKVTPDVLVYGKYSTAYLSGGASGPLVFAPETAKSWEVGLKSEFLDRRVRFNLALYDAKYANTQAAQSGSNVTSASCGTTGLPVTCTAFGVVVVSNGPVHAQGVEAELTVAPVTGITLGGSLAYTHITNNPSIAITGGRPVAPSGSPTWMGGVNGTYVSPVLFDDTTLMIRLDGNYQGKYRNTPFTDIATNTTGGQTNPGQAPWAFSKARWVVNGRIALREVKMGPLTGEVAVWGRNLFDNKDSTYLLMFGAQNVNASYQQARTLGMDFIVNF